MTETQVAQLVLNKMTQAQYESATKNATELYLTPDTPASTTVLGPVKVDGSTITAQADGTISAAGGVTASDFEAGEGLKIIQGTPSTIDVTDFNNGNIRIPWTNPTTSLDLIIHAKTPTSYGSSQNNGLLLATKDASIAAISAQIYGNNTPLRLWMSSISGSNDISNNLDAANFYSTGTDFWFRVNWNGTVYKIQYKQYGQWTNYTAITSSSAIYSNANFLQLGSYPGTESTNNWNTGHIYLYDCYLNVDGNVIFDGSSATSSDYTVESTPTITGANADPNSGKVTIMLA